MKLSDHIKQQCDIVKVVEDYGVQLKRQSAKNFVGLCCFHSEKTPSMSVNQEKQFYHCFSCQASGDVYKFVQEMESCGFQDAMVALVERYAIRLPERVYRNQVRQTIKDLESQGRMEEAIAMVDELRKGTA